MATQALIKKCWMNAFASDEDYVVPVPSMKQAIALRAQAHRWRRSQAEAIYPNCPEDHYLYQLEIKITEEPFAVTFTRGHDEIVLPPVIGAGGMWCLIRRDEGFVIEQHHPPVQDLGFVSGHDSQEEAERAKAALELEEAPPPAKSPRIFTSIKED